MDKDIFFIDRAGFHETADMELPGKTDPLLLTGSVDQIASALAGTGAHILLIGLIALEGSNKDLQNSPAAGESAVKSPGAIRFGPWTLDRSRFQVLDKQNKPANLTAREFRILEVLALRPHRVLSREQLAYAVCGDNCDSYDRAIDVQITRIRNKLGDDARKPQFIKTVYGIGYMFVAQTEIAG